MNSNYFYYIMVRTAEEIALFDVGDIKTYKIQGNNTKVLCNNIWQ